MSGEINRSKLERGENQESGFSCSYLAQFHRSSNIPTYPLSAAKCQAVFPESFFDNNTSFLISSGFSCSYLAQFHSFLIFQLGLFLMQYAMLCFHTSSLTTTLHFLSPLGVAGVFSPIPQFFNISTRPLPASKRQAVSPYLFCDKNNSFLFSSGFSCSSLAHFHNFSNISTRPLPDAICHAVFPYFFFDNNNSFLISSGFSCSSLAHFHNFSNIPTWPLSVAKCQAVFPYLFFDNNNNSFLISSGFSCSSLA